MPFEPPSIEPPSAEPSGRITLGTTIVVPSFGRPAALRACVEALMAQDHADREIVVVDDGSPEPLAPVCAGLPGVRCVRQENAPGRPLGDLRSEGALDLLATVAHLAPNEALRAVEGYIAPIEGEFALPTLRDQEVVVRILRALARDPERFGPVCALLLRLVTVEAEADDGSGARHALTGLFTLYLSSTMARTAERMAVLRHCLLGP